MGRKRDLQAKEMIVQAACRCFLQNGYQHTSYQKIAEQSGFSKSVVQFHFPKKAQFIPAFFKRLTNEMWLYLDSHKLLSSNPFASSFCLGQVYFSFLIMNPQVRQFSFDVVSSREFTEELLLFNETWCIDYFHVSPERYEQLYDTVTLSVGGAYELIYRSLKYQKEIDSMKIARQVILSLMECLGRSDQAEIDHVLSTLLSPADILATNTHLYETLLQGNAVAQSQPNGALASPSRNPE